MMVCGISGRTFGSFMIALALFLAGCVAPMPLIDTSKPEVIFQEENRRREELQEFEIDNCNGKADAKRVQERAVFIKSDVSAEIAVQLGLTVPAASAAVETAVELALGDIREHRTAMELAAPPGTRMAFELVWLENRRAGVVQIRGLNIPFEVLEPVDVRIKSQYDVGCPELTPSPINSQPASQDTMSGSLVLCGEPAFNGNLLTSEPLFLRPERYLSGWISSDPSMIVLPNGTSRVFDTQYVLIVEDLPSIQIKGVQTREGKANTWGCWYSADLASVVEEEAKKDFCVKKAGGNVAVLYRVSHTGFEQIATTATISCP